MQLQAFLAALEERIARYDLLCHPYYKAWTAGQLAAVLCPPAGAAGELYFNTRHFGR